MTNNAVYVVISEGLDLFSAMTRISVASLRATNPAFKVLMVCDAATVAAMRHRRDPLLDEVDQLITCDAGEGSGDYRSRYIKTNLRNLINGRFLFLDADTLIRGKLDEVFALDSDIACARNNSKEWVGQQMLPQDLSVLRRMEWQTRKDAYFNAGVIFCNDTPGARRFVGDWRRKWSESYIRIGNYRDQPAFNAAIFDTNVRLAILPHRFNAQIKYEPVVAEGATIWHFYASMRLPITAFEVLANELAKGIELKSSHIESIISRNHPWRRDSWVDDLAARRVLKKGDFDSDDVLWFQGYRVSSSARRMAKALPFIKQLVTLVRTLIRSSILAKVYRLSAKGLLWASRFDGPQLLLLTRYFLNVGLKGKTLVVLERAGGMGDLVCLLASVPGLRANHPNSWVTLITPCGCAQLATASGLCDAVTEAQTSFHRLLKYICSPYRYYRPLLPDERSPPQLQSSLHLAEEFAQALGTHADLDALTFRAPKRVRGRISRRLRAVNPEGRPIIVLHSGPAWPVREWLVGRWFELAESLAAMDAVIVQVGTDFDSYQRRVPVRSIPKTINWLNTLNIIELVALLEQAKVFIGIDSGPLHIATALGIPSVGLFGPTEGRLRVHPRAPVAIMAGTASCLGCHHRATGPRHWRTGCPNDILCMREIGVDRVSNVVSCALSGGYLNDAHPISNS